MPQWKCTKCGYQLEEEKPPTTCPDCKETCDFVDVTCYVPECGGPESGNTDPRLG